MKRQRARPLSGGTCVRLLVLRVSRAHSAVSSCKQGSGQLCAVSRPAAVPQAVTVHPRQACHVDQILLGVRQGMRAHTHSRIVQAQVHVGGPCVQVAATISPGRLAPGVIAPGHPHQRRTLPWATLRTRHSGGRHHHCGLATAHSARHCASAPPPAQVARAGPGRYRPPTPT